MSRGLTQTIFISDIVHTNLWEPYGTSSEDAQIGKVVCFALKAHPQLKVDYVQDGDIADGVKGTEKHETAER
jgi:hypothetical protein